MPTESVEVRLADERDRDDAFRLRHEIYVEEMALRHLDTEQDGRLRDAEDESARLLVAVVGGVLVGTLRLHLGIDGPLPASLCSELQLERFLETIPQERMMLCSRFAVRRDHRGALVPFQLLVKAAEEALPAQVELIFCDCQAHLIRLYHALGFRSHGRVFSEEGWDIRAPLVLLSADREHLRAVNSPFLQLDLELPPLSDVTRRAIELLPGEPAVRPAESLAPEQLAPGGELPRLLRGLDEEEVRSVLAHSYVIELERGTRLMSSGQVTRTVYLLLEGELEARDQQRPVRRMLAGETVGEVAFLLHRERTLDVFVSSSRALVLGLHEPTLRMMIDADARAAARLLWNLCETLAERLASPGGR